MIIIQPGASANFSTGEGGDTLSLTNNHEEGQAQYTISIDGAAAQAHTIDAGESDNYNLEGNGNARVRNTGTLNIEADFA